MSPFDQHPSGQPEENRLKASSSEEKKSQTTNSDKTGKTKSILSDSEPLRMDNKPVFARPIAVWTSARKWICRNRILALTIFFITMSILAEKARAQAEPARKNDEQETINARHLFGTTLVERAKRYEDNKDMFLAKMTDTFLLTKSN